MTESISFADRVMAGVAYESLMILDQDRQLIALNESAARLFNGEALIGAPLVEVTGSTELDSAVQYAIDNGEEMFEVQTTIQDRFYRVRTQLYERAAGEQVVGVALQDVTELVRLNRARRDMVANISHELRTPIANIRLIIDSLFHEEDKPKRKKSIQSLRAIARETDSLLWLVQELLDLSMIESGQSIVRMVDVPLEAMIESSLERMAEQSANHEIGIIAKIPSDMRVLCDKELASRIVINLMHNAIKFSPKGGTITISAEESGPYITVTVLDKGPGVPADQVERIFERFYQVDASRSKGEGTGLGLAICRHIIEAHGGTIWAVPTEEAHGGKFCFTLLKADYDHDEEL